MGWRVVKQPNNLYAIFSDIVDHFTDYDMTREEAIRECQRNTAMGIVESTAKVQRADDNPQRFNEEIQRIQRVHGKEEADNAVKLLSHKGE